jgi:hypothetical protein
MIETCTPMPSMLCGLRFARVRGKGARKPPVAWRGLLGARGARGHVAPRCATPGRGHRLRQDGLLLQHTDGLTVGTRSEEVTSVTHSNESAPDVSLRLGVAVAGRWHGDRRGSCYRAPRWGRGRSNRSVATFPVISSQPAW